MKRKIVEINGELCNGCGACANACQEGAIAMIDGKAKLMRDDYCDGLGNCLPACPTNAITIIEREADAFDEAAVENNMRVQESKLMQWPVQLKLVPTKASYFEGANLLIAADCTAYAYAKFHDDFIKNHITIIGCPKLDSIDYSEKLTEIIKNNDIKSVKVVKMEVPCCGGLERATVTALKNSGKMIPWQVITITCEGGIKED